jgi:PAS domain S-box-containing protein
MSALIFLSVAIVLQIAAAAMAFKLVRFTGRRAAWMLISAALALMALRRAIPLVRAAIGDASSPPDPVNEFVGMVLSGLMAAGVGLIGPIFMRIFRSERELAESERRFRSYFEQPLEGVAIVSPSRRWITVNDRLCEILGRSREELRSAGMDEATLAEDRERERELDRGIAEGRADGYSLDKRVVRGDGTSTWVSEAARCVRNAAGEPAYYVVILQDIAERKKAEEGLRRSISEKDALLRELYHRTKNNMQMICSMLSLESDGCDDPRITEKFRLVCDKIGSMSLVHEMLYISRDLSSIDLGDYIQDLCAMLRQGYLRAKGEVRLEISVDEGIRVPIDNAIPLGLILNELVTNSLKHAFPGSRKGCVRVSAKRSAAGEVELSVVDDGIGLPPGFDASRADSMGFHTVYALAEQLDGSVSVEAGRGVACSVRFAPVAGPDRLERSADGALEPRAPAPRLARPA